MSVGCSGFTTTETAEEIRIKSGVKEIETRVRRTEKESQGKEIERERVVSYTKGNHTGRR